MPDKYSFGIEEEFFLVDAQTKSIIRKMPAGFLDAAKAATEDRVISEFLQSQVEVVTRPHLNMVEAREDLRHLRRTLGAIAAQHGLAILASGTHPTATWVRAHQTEGTRYDMVMDDLKMIGQRNMLCGLHVHVELPNPDERIDVMMRMLPYLPLFIALAASSPFWQSQQTGLMGYRLAAYDELPRTGVPELFRSLKEYEAYIEALVHAGVIQNSSYVWWAIRPSLNNPTLELRAPDSCTRIEDTLAIAALWRTLARRLFRNPWINWDMNAVSRAIVVENKWRAQRYGIHGTFVNVGGNGSMSVAQMLDQVIEDVMPDAQALGCVAEIEHCRTIVQSGTSADAQLDVYEKNGSADTPERALRAVAEWIAATTLN